MKHILWGILMFFSLCAMFCACNQVSSNLEIEVPTEIEFATNSIELPQIKLNNSIVSWREFSYEADSGFIYIYNGKIVVASNAGDEFETSLFIYYKQDKSVCASIKVIKKCIPLQSVDIRFIDKRIYPNQTIFFDLIPYPENATIDDYTIVFDKPQYISNQTATSFTLSSDAPLNEKIDMKIMFNDFEYTHQIEVDSRVYDILSPFQLKSIALDPYGYYILQSNIDCSKLTQYPITTLNEFYGILDGNGYAIYNYYHKSASSENIGLFTKNYGVIKNLRLLGCTIDICTSPTNNLYIGLLCGRNYGTISNVQISNCSINSTIGKIVTRISNQVFSGIIAGQSERDSLIEKCGVQNCSVSSQARTGYKVADAYSAGICGRMMGTMQNCFSRYNYIYSFTKGSMSTLYGNGSLYSYSAGLIGRLYSCGTMINCVSYDNDLISISIEARNHTYSAELCSENNGKILNCYSNIKAENLILGGGGDGKRLNYVQIAFLKGFSSDIWQDSDWGINIKYDWKPLIQTIIIDLIEEQL